MAKSKKAVMYQIGPWWVNSKTLEKTVDESNPPQRYDLLELERARWRTVERAKKALFEFSKAFQGVADNGYVRMRKGKEIIEYYHDRASGTIGSRVVSGDLELGDTWGVAKAYKRAGDKLYNLEKKILEFDGELERVIRAVCPAYYQNEGREVPTLLAVPINERAYWYIAVKRNGFVSLEPYFFPNHRRETIVMTMPVDLNVLEMRKQLKEGDAKWLLKEGRAVCKKLYYEGR